MVLPHACGESRQPGVNDQLAHAERADTTQLVCGGNFRPDIVFELEHLRSELEQTLSCFGDSRTRAGSVKESLPEIRFKTGDALGQGRLRGAKPFRPEAKAVQLRRPVKRLKFL